MTTRDELARDTNNFFIRHWNSADGAPPSWDFTWDWRGPVPNYLLGGLYALFRQGELVYIGLGSSRGAGIYVDRGISRRLLSHVVRVAPDGESYVPRERWRDLEVDSVGTIGFPMALNYLAPALEDFLIGRLNPPENAVKRGREKLVPIPPRTKKEYALKELLAQCDEKAPPPADLKGWDKMPAVGAEAAL